LRLFGTALKRACRRMDRLWTRRQSDPSGYASAYRIVARKN
jgi:hypothetical protein